MKLWAALECSWYGIDECFDGNVLHQLLSGVNSWHHKRWKYWKVPWDVYRLLSGCWKSSRLGLVFQKWDLLLKMMKAPCESLCFCWWKPEPPSLAPFWNDPKHQIIIHSWFSFTLMTYVVLLSSQHRPPVWLASCYPFHKEHNPGDYAMAMPWLRLLILWSLAQPRFPQCFFSPMIGWLIFNPFVFVRCFHVHHFCEERWFHLITSDWLKRCFFRYRVMLGWFPYFSRQLENLFLPKFAKVEATIGGLSGAPLFRSIEWSLFLSTSNLQKVGRIAIGIWNLQPFIRFQKLGPIFFIPKNTRWILLVFNIFLFRCGISVAHNDAPQNQTQKRWFQFWSSKLAPDFPGRFESWRHPSLLETLKLRTEGASREWWK